MFRVKFILNEYKYVGSKFHEFETLEWIYVGEPENEPR